MRSLTIETATAIAVIAIMAMTNEAYAVGTAADTEITNTARVDYRVGTVDLSDSDSVITTVAQILDVTVSCVASPVNVSPDQNLVVTEFLITNAGNGPDTFSLVGDSSIGGDDFDPTLQEIWLDDGDGVFEGTGQDTLYNAGVNDPTINRDGQLTIFFRNNIPDSVVNGNNGDTKLTATSTLQSSPLDPVGTVYGGAGLNGVNAVVGNTRASAADVCRHTVLSVLIAITKQADILAAYNTDTVIPGEILSDAIPGAVITYTLTVTAAGSGTADNVIVSDAIPADTTYKSGNFTLDTNGLGESNGDGDAGDVTGGTVTVSLPDMTGGDIHTITFNVTID